MPRIVQLLYSLVSIGDIHILTATVLHSTVQYSLVSQSHTDPILLPSLQMSGCLLPDCQDSSSTCSLLLPLLPSLSSLSLSLSGIVELPPTLCR